MERITPYSVEKCLDVIPNRYEVALIAAQRARELKREGVSMYRTEALKEVAAGYLDQSYILKEENDIKRAKAEADSKLHNSKQSKGSRKN